MSEELGLLVIAKNQHLAKVAEFVLGKLLMKGTVQILVDPDLQAQQKQEIIPDPDHEEIARAARRGWFRNREGRRAPKTGLSET